MLYSSNNTASYSSTSRVRGTRSFRQPAKTPSPLPLPLPPSSPSTYHLPWYESPALGNVTPSPSASTSFSTVFTRNVSSTTASIGSSRGSVVRTPTDPPLPRQGVLCGDDLMSAAAEEKNLQHFVETTRLSLGRFRCVAGGRADLNNQFHRSAFFEVNIWPGAPCTRGDSRRGQLEGRAHPYLFLIDRALSRACLA